MKKIIWAGALLPLLTSTVQASVNVQTFSPALGTSYVFTEDALMQVAPGDSSWTGERMYFIFSTITRMIRSSNTTRLTRRETLFSSMGSTLLIWVSGFFLKNLMFGLDMPINWVTMPGSSAQFGWGDMKLEAKYRVTPDDAPLAVAIVPSLTVPTGDTTLYLSSGSVSYGAEIAIERDFGPFRASGNIGYRHAPNAVYLDVNYTNMIPMSLAAFIPIDNHWGINVEGSGALSMPVNHYNNPGDFSRRPLSVHSRRIGNVRREHRKCRRQRKRRLPNYRGREVLTDGHARFEEARACADGSACACCEACTCCDAFTEAVA